MAGWSILSASTSGGRHARDGVSGQDAFAADVTGGASGGASGGVLCVCVADGCGSAPLAAVGAPLAVALARRTVHRALEGPRPDGADAWRRLLDDVAGQIIGDFNRTATAVARRFAAPDTKTALGTKTAPGMKPAPGRTTALSTKTAPGAKTVPGRTTALGTKAALGTTLTVVLADPPWICGFMVGDGLVVIRTAGGDLDLLLAPPGDPADVPGATTLLTSAGAARTARRLVAHRPDLSGVAVTTDGLAPALVHYERSQPARASGAALHPIFAEADRHGTDAMVLTRLLAGTRVSALTDDDRTLVVAVTR